MKKQTVTLKASARHPTLAEGQIYEAPGREALQSIALRQATAYKHRSVVAEPPVRVKRKYTRRDMQAE